MKAFYEAHPNIDILHLDTDTGLRPSYLGNPYNHACALYEAAQQTNVVYVGTRSMNSSEICNLFKQFNE